jgi:hypothetical protein
MLLILIFPRKTLVGRRFTGRSAQVDSRDHFLTTARGVRAPRCTRSWFEHSLHVLHNLSSSTCHLRLYGSLWHSQNSGCLHDRETVNDAQLECFSQSRRQQCGAFSQACRVLKIATLFFRAGARVRDCLPHKVLFVSSRLLIPGQMNLAVAFAQLHQGTVPDNRGQPGRQLRLSSELVDMSIRRQHSFLDRVLRVSGVSQKSPSAPIKSRHAE